ncbi:MAG: Uma2 family endonuclease [Leptolyngbyaceae cyanobacterium]
MVWNPYPIPQTDPPRSPRKSLPTMYDLPSEDPEEPGLPDQFHLLQPQLLSQTCRSPRFSPEEMFCGADINLYYTIRQPLWYKRPDWFVVPGVPYLYDGGDMRRSYVIWQEGVAPLVVVELLSPGTENEDLGIDQEPYRPQDYGMLPTDTDKDPNGAVDQPADPVTEQAADRVTDARTDARADAVTDAVTNGDRPPNGDEAEAPKLKPPPKWAVYESILRVPFYAVFSRYTDQLRMFRLNGDQYEELALDPQQPQVWIAGLGLGLGLWSGTYEGVSRKWLRWYDHHDQWIPTPAEQAEAERQRAEAERQRAEVAEAQLAQEQQEKADLLERLRQLEAQLNPEEQEEQGDRP